MHSQYIYEPLSYDHEYCQPIRLIRILPGVSDEPILCELFKTYLTTSEGRQKRESVEGTLQETPENLEYDALSYAWGDAQDRVAIHVNGKTLLVTQNLWSFLRHQRDTFAPTDNSDRTFWIDAICIDQMNLVERSKQVAFMADIYKEAKLVLAWLGEEDNASRMAFDFLLCPDTYDSSVLEYVEDALFDTFDGGYWDRLWIVQELHHARRIIVRCGPRELDWKLIRPRAHPGPLARITEIEDYRESRNPQHQSKWDEHSQALAVLETYGIKGCTDPRDSVFGLRSLTYDLIHELEGNIVLTTKTGYAGIAFGEPKMDDILFVAYGSRYPFIIRRSEAAEESYKLIGCAYIQGLMNGESIELKAAGKAKERTIFLV
ncbi:hypothetical protein ACLOAV_010286 [Pseudogymnoascus australis]